MSFQKMELFGHITYSPDLSYHDLLSREEEIKSMVQQVLEKEGGEFIHFEALGDALRFQCVLADEREDTFQALCDDLAPHMQNGLDARLLLVDKDLDGIYFYSISNGKWQEAVLALPPAGYLTPAPKVRVVRQHTDHPRK